MQSERRKLNWEDWERFKGTLYHFIQGNEILYKEFDESKEDNVKPKGKPYFLFEDAVSLEKINRRVSRIPKTVTTHYKYRHIHELYTRPSTNPLALSMYNKISNLGKAKDMIFRSISTGVRSL
jgi:hypothetical protein